MAVITDKIIRVTLEIPENVAYQAKKRADKNRRSRNSQIVHDVETANRNEQPFIVIEDFERKPTKTKVI